MLYFVLIIFIRDVEGRNIIFWDMSNYDIDVTPEPVLMRTFVYCLERATEKYCLFLIFLKLVVFDEASRVDAQTKGIIVLANLSNWSMARFSMRIVNSFFGTVRVCYLLFITHFFILSFIFSRKFIFLVIQDY